MNSDCKEYKLIDVVDLKSGTTVKKGLELKFGDVAYIKVSGMNLEGNEKRITTSNEYLNHEDINIRNIFPIGTTIFPKRGGAIATNKKRLTEIPLCVDLNTMGAIPKSGLVIPLYVYFYFQSFDLLSISNGTTIPQINNYSFDKLKIFVPPIPEQKRIVSILDTVFADLEQTRAKTEQNLKNARELFDSYLQQVFSQKGEGWVEKTISELSTKLGDGLHGTPIYSEDGEYSFINGNNLNDGVIDLKEKTKKVSEIEFQKYKKELNDRTILVSINGTLGNVAFYNNEKVILGKSACYFNLNEGINKEYIKLVIESELFQKYAENVATGATIKNVSLKSMRAFPVPIAPEYLQNEIVENLNQLKLFFIRLSKIYKAKLNAIDELKKSILPKAFLSFPRSAW